MDLQQAKKALEKAAQQYQKNKTWLTEIDFHKARADLLEARNAILKAECKRQSAKIEQLQNTARILKREGMEERGFVPIGTLAGNIAYDLQDNIPPYGRPMTAKERAEALFSKDAAE